MGKSGVTMGSNDKRRTAQPPSSFDTPLARFCEARGCLACTLAHAALPGRPKRASNEPLGVAVVDGDSRVRRLFARVLQTSDTFQCSGCFSTAGAALEAIPRLPVRMVLVGLSLPDLPCGLQCVRNPQLLRPGLRLVLLVPAGREAAMTAAALAMGARECRAAPRNAQQCLELLNAAAEGLGPALLRVPLTAREEAILSCRREGHEWKEIKEKLQISSHSVVTKLRKRIFKKLGVSGTAAAIRRWEELRGGERSATTLMGSPPGWPPPGMGP